MYIWALIKERGISVKPQSGFVDNINKLTEAGIDVPDKGKILELNNARVAFKHYGNLPAPDEARKFQIYAQDFLRAATKAHFDKNFDNISLVDLVTNSIVRQKLKSAEVKVQQGEYKAAVIEIAIAKELLFRMMEKQIPQVDGNLNRYDSVFSQVSELGHVQVFNYIEKYLRHLRELVIVTLLQLPFDKYSFLQSNLPYVTQFMNGRWEANFTRSTTLSEEVSARLITIAVEMSIRIDGVIGNDGVTAPVL